MPRLTFEALLGKSIILAFVLFELFLELNQTVASIKQLNDAAATKGLKLNAFSLLK